MEQEPRSGGLITDLAKPGFLVGAVLAMAVLAVVLALNVVEAEDSLDTGVGSPTACLTANVTGTIDAGDPGFGEDVTTIQAGAGNVVNMICIKTGQDIFLLGGIGACANVPTNGTKSSHSPCITADGQYANGLCYMVSGMGTAKVTVTRKLASCPAGSGISHVDFLAKDPRVPLTPTPTPTPTPTQPPLGGGGVFPDVPGTGGSSWVGYGVMAGIFAAVTAGALALGGGAWYRRRRSAS